MLPHASLKGRIEMSKGTDGSAAILTYKEAAIRLACSPRTVKALIAEGKLTPFKFPGRTRSHGVKASEVARFIAQG
jgi:excisionase family DNA binding protein